MIPKKIHYCWFGGGSLPELAQKCIKSWKKYCPDYEIIEWNESNFDVTLTPFMKEAYESKAWAFVSDYARLKIIHENGGFYLDTDVELVKSLDLLCENKCYFGIERDSAVIATGLGFGAEKGNDIIFEMMKEYDNVIFSKENMTEIACPIFNTRVLEKRGFVRENRYQVLGDVVVYPPEYFDPISPWIKTNLVCKETISVHHYNASWNQEEKDKKQIFQKVHKLLPFGLAKMVSALLAAFKNGGLENVYKKFKKKLNKGKQN